MNENELIKKAITNQEIKPLVKYFFQQLPFEPTPTQYKIIKDIAFVKHKRLLLNAMTRYGKSQTLGIAIGLYIILNKNKKVVIIAPQSDQTKIIRTYLAEAINWSWALKNLVQLSTEGIERLSSESSQKKQTFKNGCSYEVFSAEGEANRLMGVGTNGLLIVDEACLINSAAQAKIRRMLGDNPEEVALIQLANPWTRACQYYRDWTNPSFKKYHIGWKEALAEGRTTREFIEEQRKVMSPLEFTVLYESNFPEESEDSLFKLEWINRAVNKFNIKTTDENDNPIKGIKQIVSCDVADKGFDKTVSYHGRNYGNHYQVLSHWYENKSESMKVAKRVFDQAVEFTVDDINIDPIGVGVGVLSRLKELLVEHRHIRVNACHFGKKASKPDRFINKKAEMYWRLRELLEDGLVSFPDIPELVNDLVAMRWEETSGGKIRIVDPDDHSPDFSDSLVYFVWKISSGSFHIS